MAGRMQARGAPRQPPGKPARCLPCSLGGLLLLAALVGTVVLLLR